MTHIAFQERGQDVSLEADYVVVGSGAGGSAAAVTLARAGHVVALIEAGPWRDPDDYPNSVYGAMRDMISHFGSIITAGRAFWPVVQASLVGGTTVVNSAIAVRTPGDIFEQWEREHGVGGDEMAEKLWSFQDDLERELSVEEIQLASLGRSNELALQAGKALGIENHVMRRYHKDCAGHGACFQGCKARRKQSTNLNYIPEVIKRDGMVVSCAPASKILFEGTTAVGVVGDFQHPSTRKKGARFEVRAKRGVLVAASATQSPLLLKRSRIKKNVGANFRAHPGTPILGVYDEPVDLNMGATQGWASTEFRERPGFKLETLSLPLDMVSGRWPGGGSTLMERVEDYRHLAIWVQATRAETVGSVSHGLAGQPMVRYSMNPPDMERLRAGNLEVAKLHFAAGAKAIIPTIHGLPYKLGPDDLHLLENAPLEPRAYVAILSHLFGGCVMGKDPKTSVCDGAGRVHGVDNVSVVDASAIPTNLGVNPQHTIMALARYCAEHMLS